MKLQKFIFPGVKHSLDAKYVIVYNDTIGVFYHTDCSIRGVRILDDKDKEDIKGLRKVKIEETEKEEAKKYALWYIKRLIHNTWLCCGVDKYCKSNYFTLLDKQGEYIDGIRYSVELETKYNIDIRFWVLKFLIDFLEWYKEYQETIILRFGDDNWMSKGRIIVDTDMLLNIIRSIYRKEERRIDC